MNWWQQNLFSMKDIYSNESLIEARARAARYEGSLEPNLRKTLGQFFTGLPLGRILAAIAFDNAMSSVIDPMAGHGDLLDAVAERAARMHRHIQWLQGGEIDPPTADMCRERLQGWNRVIATLSIRALDAFNPVAAGGYLADGYDLVITNPPYVRYQTLATKNGNVPQLPPDKIRQHLVEIVRKHVPAEEFPSWQRIMKSYSGLADLSVPAWILCAALVRPGGTLALVAPATWRSRDYGSVIEYLLGRFFRLEYLIEDTQPGWFSDALVRTQLVVARRLPVTESRMPPFSRPEGKPVLSVKVSPVASGNNSLVGSAFLGDDPEGAFASWMRSARAGTQTEALGLNAQVSPLWDILENALTLDAQRKRSGSIASASKSLFENSQTSPLALVPRSMRSFFRDVSPTNLVFPAVAGLSISQGLRTGCNGFFYVDHVDKLGSSASIRLSSLFNNEELKVPAECCLPVVRRQSEVAGPVDESRLDGRVLDLSGWVLPEDLGTVERARGLYEREGIRMPKVMPGELANFVRRAAETVYAGGHEPKRIRELSAVRTNVRLSGNGRSPRFWYMLPPFARRHRPDAFVPRVNQGIPWIEINADPPVLIDANFLTIWSDAPGWTRFALRAILNSAWCRACMEALGTPLGGGALKLEAAQLRRLPLPKLGAAELATLHAQGSTLTPAATAVPESVNRFVLAKITGIEETDPRLGNLLKDLESFSEALCCERQRK